MVSMSEATLCYGSAYRIGHNACFTVDILLKTGTTLFYGTPLMYINAKPNMINVIFPCTYRNSGNGLTRVGHCLIDANGNLYSCESDSNYNEIRVNGSYWCSIAS